VMQATGKTAVDVTAVSAAAASYLTWLPEIAAAFSILWFAVRIYDYFRFERPKRMIESIKIFDKKHGYTKPYE
jgi:hypothetical protein